MRKNAIVYLIEYANKKHLLPLTGAKLFDLQEEAYAIPKTFDEDLNQALIAKFNLTLKQWQIDTQYMREHYWPSLKEEHIEINRFIYTFGKQHNLYIPARQLNYFYSLLNNAYKREQISRQKKNGVYEYHLRE